MTLKKLLLKLLFFIISILLLTVIFNHVMDTGSKDHFNYRTLKLTMSNSFKPGPIYVDKDQPNYRNLSSSNSSTEIYLDSLELKNVIPDFAFVSKNCDNNLDMKQWAPASVKGKICLFPLSKDRVSRSWHLNYYHRLFSSIPPPRKNTKYTLRGQNVHPVHCKRIHQQDKIRFFAESAT